MQKKLPILYSALLLTGVNLLLRFAGTSFQVYLSGRIGAAGIGLLQLVMSVGSLAMVAGMGGIRTATMYLTAEELGRNRHRNVTWVLSACFLYSICFSGCTAAILYGFAPQIAALWIGDSRTVEALRLFAAFLPVVCLCGVMTGYFTAAGRIGTLATVEVAEQICSMILTFVTLSLLAGSDPVRSCFCVIIGSACGSIMTLCCLILLHRKDHLLAGPRIRVGHRLAQTALPLAVADDLKSGINTIENLMVPKRLQLNLRISNPLAAFGMVSGMVFPVIMFPAAILFALAELLIPELARCNAAGSTARIHYLVRKALLLVLVYALAMGGVLYLLADLLCMRLYGTLEACRYMRGYALLVPMLYLDIITDAMTKGLGQQKTCVRYNIFTSFLDVVFLYILLPQYGMDGYYLSFFITHLINFLLSMRRLLKITVKNIPIYIPLFSIASMIFALWAGQYVPNALLSGLFYLIILICLLFLFGILSSRDVRWIRTLTNKK